MAIVMARQSGSASGAGTTINTSPSNTAAAAQDLSKAVLDSTINIPPTIYKNRGELVTIYVARDLRFDSVYVLR
jgi:type IV secretion system protein VirB10